MNASEDVGFGMGFGVFMAVGSAVAVAAGMTAAGTLPEAHPVTFWILWLGVGLVATLVIHARDDRRHPMPVPTGWMALVHAMFWLLTLLMTSGAPPAV